MGKLSKEEIIESLKEMTLLEVHDLIKAIEETFEVSAAAPVAVAASGGGAEEEKTDFTVQIAAVGESKVAVIKVVKAVLGVGLLDAKKMVDGDLPVIIKEGASKEEAEDLKKQLTEAGATVELK